MSQKIGAKEKHVFGVLRGVNIFYRRCGSGSKCKYVISSRQEEEFRVRVGGNWGEGVG